jgi:hypothetical protein
MVDLTGEDYREMSIIQETGKLHGIPPSLNLTILVYKSQFADVVGISRRKKKEKQICLLAYLHKKEPGD